jgi:hypothetical protein
MVLDGSIFCTLLHTIPFLLDENPIITTRTTTTSGRTVPVFSNERGDLNGIVPDTLDDIYISKEVGTKLENRGGAEMTPSGFYYGIQINTDTNIFA